jgi:ATP-dependent DNA helicase RecG
MQPSLTKLRKFFRLEAERQYDNRAVMGGMQKMLRSWEAEARSEDVNEPLIMAVTGQLRNYEDLDPEIRAEALKNVWQRISREIGEDPAPTKRKAASATKAPAGRKPTAKKQPERTQLVRIKERPVSQRPTKSDSAPKPVKAKAKPAKSSNAPQLRAEGTPAALNAAVTVLTGVGPVNAERLEKLGIHTLRDMLYHFPRRYDDYSQRTTVRNLKYGQQVTVIGTIKSKSNRPPIKKLKKIFEVVVDDGTGALRVAWFNQPWMSKNMQEGDQIVLSGTVDQYLGRLTLTNPEWELLEADQLHTNRIVPVYPLTANIGQRWLRGLMNKVVGHWAPRVPEPLPQDLVSAAGLVPLSEALLQAHFPDSQDGLQAARVRLAFDELFLLQLAVLIQKKIWQGQAARKFSVSNSWLHERLQALPFQLTHAQSGALADLIKDLGSGRPMNRLLQGDVGSGKTVVAALAMAAVAAEVAQAALMAPTSILAEQHYEMRLMIGATPESVKQEIRAGLNDGSIKIVIGTHTLIEDPVLFAALEMIVIDEQHRFGVGQRAALRAKGNNPHLLVMTATPIPRSLALTLYGDLDLSVIGELPPGRQEISTHILLPRERERAYNLIRKEVDAGRQAFVIYPLIEESETSVSKAAVEEHKRLQKEVFPGYKVTLLHGRMSAEEKETAMARFRDGKSQVLVSTTVIEVGVDVPNASVMLIESANRFGLAQLHQLRGRVGRGSEKSYCLLVPENDDAAENERLKALAETNDGFLLAEKDLQQRGPGQFLGGQQSGFLDLRLASLTDSRLIHKARLHAEELLASDPELAHPQNHALAAALIQYVSDGKGDLS